MRFVFLILVLFTVSKANAQDNACIAGVQKETDDPKFARCSKQTQKYLNRDFSDLLIPSSDFIGFIGNDYQRLYIKLTSVLQDKNNKKIYHVRGNSQVKANKMDFEGEIEVIDINILAPHYENDDRFKNDGIKAQGILSAKYELREDSSQKASGRFVGNMMLRWLVDKDNELQYDVYDSSKSNNNQYSGKWISYETKAAKVANWGEGGIPNAGDLDQSSDGFWPNSKYVSKGWENYSYPQRIESRKSKLRDRDFGESSDE